MIDLRTAAQMALEALALEDGGHYHRKAERLLRASLAAEPQPVAEPLKGWKLNHVAFKRGSGKAEIGFLDPEDDRFSPVITVDTGLYYQHDHAVPLARAVLSALTANHMEQPLTDEQMLEILGDVDAATKRLPPGIKAFARAIERAHGIGG